MRNKSDAESGIGCSLDMFERIELQGVFDFRNCPQKDRHFVAQSGEQMLLDFLCQRGAVGFRRLEKMFPV
jgi:hypothetical protein